MANARLIFSPTLVTGATGPAGANGGISLTGWQLLLKADDLYGAMNGQGISTGNAAVFVYYSSTNASGDVAALGVTTSATDVFQSRFAFGQIGIPSYATGFGASGLRVRMLSSNTATGSNAVSMRISDPTGTTVTISDMVSSTALAVRDYSISGASLPPFSRDIWMSRFDFRVTSGNTGSFVALEGHFV